MAVGALDPADLKIDGETKAIKVELEAEVFSVKAVDAKAATVGAAEVGAAEVVADLSSQLCGCCGC